MWRKFLYWLTGFLPVRVINGDHNEPYLERYYLFGFGGCAVFIHRFIASDPDRGVHDHPWGVSASIVLSGGYREIRPNGTRMLRAPALNIILGDDFHRLLLDPGTEAWTLFFHGRRMKGWGFQRDGKYFPYARDESDHRTCAWWRDAPRGRTIRRMTLSQRA